MSLERLRKLADHAVVALIGGILLGLVVAAFEQHYDDRLQDRRLDNLERRLGIAPRESRSFWFNLE